MTAVLASSAAAVALYMAGVWLLSLRLRDASIADVFWGPGRSEEHTSELQSPY